MQGLMKPKELQELLESGQKFQVIDVRSPGEYASGHVPMAVNMPLEQVEGRLDDMHPEEPLVLVCQSGTRAAMCGEILKSHRGDFYLLEGGTTAWVSEGLPVVRSTQSRWALERQVRLIAGLLILTGVGLSLSLHPGWIGLSAFVGAGLTFAGATNICPMGMILSLMPWNKPKASAPEPRLN